VRPVSATAQVLLNPTGAPFRVRAPKDVIDTVKSRTTIATAALAGAFAAPAGAQTRAHALLHPTIAGQTVRAQLHHAAHRVLLRSDDRLARSVRRLGGEAPSRARLADMPNRRLRRLHTSLIRDKRELRREAAAPAVSGTLQAIAACESGGNPSTNTGNGFYGKYQFSTSTWASVGGTGNPAAASEAEQDRRAARLYAQAGSSPWPVCGQ
jgi:hypothetical protein